MLCTIRCPWPFANGISQSPNGITSHEWDIPFPGHPIREWGTYRILSIAKWWAIRESYTKTNLTDLRTKGNYETCGITVMLSPTVFARCLFSIGLWPFWVLVGIKDRFPQSWSSSWQATEQRWSCLMHLHRRELHPFLQLHCICAASARASMSCACRREISFVAFGGILTAIESGNFSNWLVRKRFLRIPCGVWICWK